jgi:hypothetical protein
MPLHVLVTQSGLTDVRGVVWPDEELALHLAKERVPGQMVAGLLSDAVELVCFSDGSHLTGHFRRQRLVTRQGRHVCEEDLCTKLPLDVP